MNREGEAIIGPAHVVGFARRAGARVVDTLAGLSLGLTVGVFGGVLMTVLEHLGQVQPGWQQKLQGLDGWSMLLSLGGTTAYHTLCEGLHGSTLGKLIFGLRVVRLDGRAVGLGPAFIRSLWFLIDGLFFGLVAHGEMSRGDLKQRLGDKRAHTVVIRSSGPGEKERPGSVAFVLALLLGVTAWAALLLTGFMLRMR